MPDPRGTCRSHVQHNDADRALRSWLLRPHDPTSLVTACSWLRSPLFAFPFHQGHQTATLTLSSTFRGQRGVRRCRSKLRWEQCQSFLIDQCSCTHQASETEQRWSAIFLYIQVDTPFNEHKPRRTARSRQWVFRAISRRIAKCS